MSISTQRRAEIRTTHRRHDNDTGSPEVQIALLTERIQQVDGHLKSNTKDNHSRRGLVMMVSRRNKLLRYLARTDHKGYQQLITKLGLRK